MTIFGKLYGDPPKFLRSGRDPKSSTQVRFRAPIKLVLEAGIATEQCQQRMTRWRRSAQIIFVIAADGPFRTEKTIEEIKSLHAVDFVHAIEMGHLDSVG